MKGSELKAVRLKARIRQREVADAMGVSQMRIANLEATEKPTIKAVERYMVAIDEIKATF